MIRVDHVTKKYESFVAVQDVSCVYKRNSIFGLVGHNGAGKTTLMKTICGIFKQESGTITLDDYPIYENIEAKQRIFFIPDDLFTLPQATMAQMGRFYKHFYPRWNDKAFQRLTDIFELDCKKRIAKFSKGMKRQAFIIFALCASPDFLILDEALDGVDPVKQELIRQLLLEAIAEKEMGIVLSSHHLREMEDMCDRIGLMQNNSLTFEKDVDEMKQTSYKYRLALSENGKGTDLQQAGIEYRNLKEDGKIITFSVLGDKDEVLGRLQSVSPLFVEVVPMTLEEIFLLEMEAKSYDLKGIL